MWTNCGRWSAEEIAGFVTGSLVASGGEISDYHFKHARDKLGDHRSAARMWPLLLPGAVIISQLIRPTVLGWPLILLPTLLYFGVGVYYAITNNLGPHPQWEHDSEGVILGSVLLAALLGVCVALLFAGRPKAFHGTRP